MRFAAARAPQRNSLTPPSPSPPVTARLQFHWWDYGLRSELEATLRGLQRLQAAGKIRELALTNFDTPHVVWMVDELKIPLASNQVQFSLVDQRPLRAMAPACAARGVQLLCYGTLLGGLLSAAWVGRGEPSGAELATPSLRKYSQMVRAWGGWPLFQELLQACARVGARHGVSVSVVGLAWVRFLRVAARRPQKQARPK